jgi:hypothetical protein
MDDAELLAMAEQALTEIKVNHGLSERHASVLAALRIRLKGSDLSSLDALLEAADDEPGSRSLDDEVADAERRGGKKRSLDDLLAEPTVKPDWPT